LVSEPAFLGHYFEPQQHHISQITMPRVNDVQQQLQQAIDELQNHLNTQSKQIQGQLAAQREAQEQAQAQLRELITGLGVQVMQLSNRTPEGMPQGG